MSCPTPRANGASVRDQLDEMTARPEPAFPVVPATLTDAEADVKAFSGFPFSDLKKIWSTNPLEPVTGRSSGVPTWSGFPRRGGGHRLPGASLLEVHERVGGRRAALSGAPWPRDRRTDRVSAPKFN